MHEVKATSSQMGYDNSGVLHQIHRLKEEGLKINLFVGRAPYAEDVPLPQSCEGEVWVSLDLLSGDQEFLKINPQRLHLVIDCNESEQMKSISNLFDRVVVDVSTVKNFESDSFSGFVNLVKKGGSFIFPNDSTTMEYGEENGFSPFRLTVSDRKMNAYGERLVECFADFCKQFGDVGELKTRWAFMNTYQDQIVTCEAYQKWVDEMEPSLRKSLEEDCPKHIQAGEFLDAFAAEKGITPPTYREEQAIRHEKTKKVLQEHFNRVKFHEYNHYFYRDGDLRTYFEAFDKK